MPESGYNLSLLEAVNCGAVPIVLSHTENPFVIGESCIDLDAFINGNKTYSDVELERLSRSATEIRLHCLKVKLLINPCLTTPSVRSI